MASWTPELTEMPRQLWSDGHSCSVIGARIGKSRNSVIGRVSRLGLPSRKTVASFHSRRSKKRLPAPAKPQKPMSPFRKLYLADPEPYVPPAEELVIPLHERKTVATLEPGDCRWPIGDPQQPDFHFCGKGKVPGLPYCDVHARRAFQPPQPRRAPHVPAGSNVIALPVPKSDVVAA